MPASNRIFLIAGAAFAAGIAGTAFFGAGTPRDRPAEVTPKTQSAWSDPVKAPARVAADAAARPPLRFQPETVESGAVATRAAASKPLPPERPSSRRAAAEAKPVVAAEAPTAPVRRPVVREARGPVRTSFVAPRDRLAERPAPQTKLRVSSAEPGGVMQWLMERR